MSEQPENKNEAQDEYEFLVNNPEEVDLERLEKLESAGYEFLNNFWTHIRKLSSYLNSTDTRTHEEIIREKYKNSSLLDQVLGQHSQIYLKQTDKEFGETLDAVLKESSFDVEKLRELVKDGSSKATDEKSKILLPIYKKLRELGYNHYPELIA